MWSYNTEKVIKDSKYYDLNLSNRVKEKSYIVNIRKLSKVPSTSESTLYTSSTRSVYTLHLTYPKYYELYK